MQEQWDNCELNEWTDADDGDRWNYTHFSPSSAGGALANVAISSPGSWPFPLGIAFTSSGAVSIVSAILSSLIPRSGARGSVSPNVRWMNVTGRVGVCLVLAVHFEVCVFLQGSVGEQPRVNSRKSFTMTLAGMLRQKQHKIPCREASKLRSCCFTEAKTSYKNPCYISKKK